MKEAFEKIQSINPEQRVVIWTSSNASEQTGLRLVLYLLKKKKQMRYIKSIRMKLITNFTKEKKKIFLAIREN